MNSEARSMIISTTRRKIREEEMKSWEGGSQRTHIMTIQMKRTGKGMNQWIIIRISRNKEDFFLSNKFNYNN